MNRRDFGLGLAALGAAPALPLRAATPPAFSRLLHSSVTHLVQMEGAGSVALVMQRFGASRTAATCVLGQLLRDGIVSAADTAGIYRTTLRLGQSPAVTAAPSIRPATRSAMTRRLPLADEPTLRVEPEPSGVATQQTSMAQTDEEPPIQTTV